MARCTWLVLSTLFSYIVCLLMNIYILYKTCKKIVVQSFLMLYSLWESLQVNGKKRWRIISSTRALRGWSPRTWGRYTCHWSAQSTTTQRPIVSAQARHRCQLIYSDQSYHSNRLIQIHAESPTKTFTYCYLLSVTSWQRLCPAVYEWWVGNVNERIRPNRVNIYIYIYIYIYIIGVSRLKWLVTDITRSCSRTSSSDPI